MVSSLADGMSGGDVRLRANWDSKPAPVGFLWFAARRVPDSFLRPARLHQPSERSRGGQRRRPADTH
jgi:hypothetical protein